MDNVEAAGCTDALVPRLGVVLENVLPAFEATLERVACFSDLGVGLLLGTPKHCQHTLQRTREMCRGRFASVPKEFIGLLVG